MVVPHRAKVRFVVIAGFVGLAVLAAAGLSLATADSPRPQVLAPKGPIKIEGSHQSSTISDVPLPEFRFDGNTPQPSFDPMKALLEMGTSPAFLLERDDAGIPLTIPANPASDGASP